MKKMDRIRALPADREKEGAKGRLEGIASS